MKISVRGLQRLVMLALMLTLGGTSWGQRAISTQEAQNHIGEYSKVCGLVASAHFASRSRGAPTFLNLDQPYPNQVFTALIWIEDRPRFGAPERLYAGRNICVSGVIEAYRGVPEVILRNPSQVKVVEPAH